MYLSPDCHHAQTASERSSGRNSLPLYGSVRLRGALNVVIFDAASLSIWIDRMGVPTLSGSVLELKRYVFRPWPRFINIAVATEEEGVAKGSSKEADSSLSEIVVAIFVSFRFVADGCLVLIKRCSHGDDSREFPHMMLSAVTESCSSVARKASALNPASSTTSTQPREGFGLNKLLEMLMRACSVCS